MTEVTPSKIAGPDICPDLNFQIPATTAKNTINIPANQRSSRELGFQLIEMTAMNPHILPFVGAVLLVLGSLLAWCLTVLQLPGNWLIVLLTALAAWLMPEETRFNVSWLTLGIVLGLAVVGEVLELATGAVAAKKQGASRRAVVLSLLGGIAGALFGAGGGSVVPVLGTLIGILSGGAGGAFLGAYLGETWKGRSDEQALAVGRAVAIGRTLGVLGKMSVGVVMVLVVAWDAFF